MNELVVSRAENSYLQPEPQEQLEPHEQFGLSQPDILVAQRKIRVFKEKEKEDE